MIGLMACVALFINADAQDTLFLNNGTEVYVKVTEIGEHSISYKKKENINGPVYTMDISKVFMAVYSNGKRETFTKNTTSDQPQSEEDESKPALNDDYFEVRLVDTKTTTDKKNKYETISVSVNVYSDGNLFTGLLLSTQKPVNNKAKPLKAITIVPLSEKVGKLLWGKYESYSGKGDGWDLSSNFYVMDTSSCYVDLHFQKMANKEAFLGIGGRSSTVFRLKDCSTLEKRFLSVALVWLGVNFEKK